MPASYRTDQILAAIIAILYDVQTPAQTFDMYNVSTTELDPQKLNGPSAVLRAVSGSSVDKAPRIALGEVVYQLDFYAPEGTIDTVDRAVTDMRNALESPGSALEQLGNQTLCLVRSWTIVQGTETQRTANHRARLEVAVDYVYPYGQA